MQNTWFTHPEQSYLRVGDIRCFPTDVKGPPQFSINSQRLKLIQEAALILSNAIFQNPALAQLRWFWSFKTFFRSFDGHFWKIVSTSLKKKWSFTHVNRSLYAKLRTKSALLGLIFSEKLKNSHFYRSIQFQVKQGHQTWYIDKKP